MTNVFATEVNVDNGVDCADFLWEEWEEYKGDIPFWQHTFCGSVAGIMEHVCMYPLDTMKTHFQTYGRWGCKERSLDTCDMYSCLNKGREKNYKNVFNETDVNMLIRKPKPKMDVKCIYTNPICDMCVNKPCSFREEFLLRGKICPNMNVNMLHRNNYNFCNMCRNDRKKNVLLSTNSKNRNGDAVKINKKNLNMMHILTTLKKRKKLKASQIEGANANKERNNMNRKINCVEVNSLVQEKGSNVLRKKKKKIISSNKKTIFENEIQNISRSGKGTSVLLKYRCNKLQNSQKFTKKKIRKRSNISLLHSRFIQIGRSYYWKKNRNLKYHFSTTKNKNICIDSTSVDKLKNNIGFCQLNKIEKFAKRFMYIENKCYKRLLFKRKNNINGNDVLRNICRKFPILYFVYRDRKYMHTVANDKYNFGTNSRKEKGRNLKYLISKNIPKLKKLYKKHTILKIPIKNATMLNATKKQHLNALFFGFTKGDTSVKNFMNFFNWESKQKVENNGVSTFWKNNENFLLRKLIGTRNKDVKLSVGEHIIMSKYNMYTGCRNLNGFNYLKRFLIFNSFLKNSLKKENVRSLCGFTSILKNEKIVQRIGDRLKSYQFFNNNLLNGNAKTLHEMSSINNIRLMKNNIFNLYKGVNVVILGCIPAHTLYFSTFEYSKKYLMNVNLWDSLPCDKNALLQRSLEVSDEKLDSNGIGEYVVNRTYLNDSNVIHSEKPIQKINEVNYLIIGISGFLATLAHDAIVAPMDTLKQRIQLGINKGGLDTFKILQENGIRSLYLSFPVTLLMNVPYQIIMMCINEKMKKIYFEHMCKENYMSNNNTNAHCNIENNSIAKDKMESVKVKFGEKNETDQSDAEKNLNSMNIINKMKTENQKEKMILSWIEENLEKIDSSDNFFNKNEKINSEKYENKIFCNKEKESIEKIERERDIFCNTTTTDLSNSEKGKYVDLKNMHIKKDIYVNKRSNHITSYFVCAGIGGGVAAVLTNPLDVIKTRIQTQCLNAKKFQLFKVVSNMYYKEGIASFFKGSLARMTLCIPASAISWGSYETMKLFFKLQLNGN